MTAAPLRVVVASEPGQALADLIRPEFCVELYLPARDNAYLYGRHCAIDGCERPGNELIVDSRRLCQRHAQRFKRATLSIGEFLASAPVIAARTALTGLPRYDLTGASTTTRDELRFLMQSIHDGQFSLTFSTQRWNALRAIYATGGSDSLIDIDLGGQPPARVATASGKRFQRFLSETGDHLNGVHASRHDDVWPQALYACFAKAMQGPHRSAWTSRRFGWRDCARRPRRSRGSGWASRGSHRRRRGTSCTT